LILFLQDQVVFCQAFTIPLVLSLQLNASLLQRESDNGTGVPTKDTLILKLALVMSEVLENILMGNECKE